ncbi:MAG TPA: RNA-binding domain-containing protein [Thermoplasmata archaeon]|jgi:hypothetical protein|nr:RNA-binding domain-containing protein [Thermoplasmata archaeon]
MFHWVELRAFVHATEDEEKVVAAMRTVMADGELRRDVLEGHFRNPLVALTVRTEKAAEVREFWRRLLAARGKEQVLDDLAARIDEDSVYHLRVDKQRAFLGTIEPASTTDILDLSAKVAAFPNKREIALRVAREFLEAL